MRLIELKPLGLRLRSGDLRALASSIRRLGLLEPILVTPDGRVASGHRRLEALRLLGYEEIPDEWIRVVEEDPVEVFAASNLCRRPLGPEERLLLRELLLLRGAGSEAGEPCVEAPGRAEKPLRSVPVLEPAGRAQMMLDAVLGTALAEGSEDLPGRAALLLLLLAGAAVGLAALLRRTGGSGDALAELSRQAGEAAPAVLRALREAVRAVLELLRLRIVQLSARLAGDPGDEVMTPERAAESLEVLQDDFLFILARAEEVLDGGRRKDAVREGGRPQDPDRHAR